MQMVKSTCKLIRSLRLVKPVQVKEKLGHKRHQTVNLPAACFQSLVLELTEQVLVACLSLKRSADERNYFINMMKALFPVQIIRILI